MIDAHTHESICERCIQCSWLTSGEAAAAARKKEKNTLFGVVIGLQYHRRLTEHVETKRIEAHPSTGYHYHRTAVNRPFSI